MEAKNETGTNDATVSNSTDGLGNVIDKTKYVQGNDEEFFANGYNDVYYEDIDFSRHHLSDKPSSLFDRVYDFFYRAKKAN